MNALYPAMVDADLVAAQFDVVRHMPGWNDAATFQQRAFACPPSMVELRKIYSIMIILPVTSAKSEWSCSKLALIKSKLRTTCSQQRLEKLLLCSVERDIVQRVNVEKFFDRFDRHNRHINLSLTVELLLRQLGILTSFQILSSAFSISNFQHHYCCPRFYAHLWL